MINKIKNLIDENNNIIIIFANIKFKNKILQRIKEFKNLKIKNYIIIAIDRQLQLILNKRKINNYFYPIQINGNYKRNGILWIKRTYLWYLILKNGINILHADADAVWKKNPFKLFTNKSISIYFTNGTIWPRNTFKVWGFTIRCGLFYVVANKTTIDFFYNVHYYTKKFKDDQVALNTLLLQDNIKWQLNNIYYETINNKKISYSTKNIPNKYKNINIILMSHNLFPRFKTKYINQAYVIDLL